MLKRALLFLFGLVNYGAFGQQVTFETHLDMSPGVNDFAENLDMIETSSGYVFLSQNALNQVASAIYLSKTDFSGNLLWSYKYTNPGAITSKSMIRTSDQGFMILSSIGVTDSSNVLLIKTDSSGIIQWSKNLHLSGSIYGVNPVGIQQTSDGGYAVLTEISHVFWVIIGNIAHGGTVTKFMLTRTDASGQVLWSKRYDTNCVDDNVYPKKLLIRNTGNGEEFIIMSEFQFGINFCNYPYHGGNKLLLLQLDSNGNEIRSRYIAFLWFSCIAFVPVDITNTPDGGLLIGGNMDYYNLNNEIRLVSFMIKTDNALSPVWFKTYYKPNIHQLNATLLRTFRVAATASNEYLLIGNISHQANMVGDAPYFMRTNVAGNILQAKRYVQPVTSQFSGFYNIIATGDGGELIAGWLFDGNSNPDKSFLLKTDQASTNNCSIDTTAILSDYFYTTYDSGITVTEYPAFSTPFYVTGQAFNPVQTMICQNGVGIAETQKENPISISPNPVHETVNLRCTFGNYEIQIYNCVGQMVLREQRHTETATVSATALPPGVYLLRVRSENRIAETKFVKQ